MVFFGVDVSSNKDIAKKFISDTNKRLGNPAIMKNPFKGGIILFDKYSIAVFDLEPIYPNFSLFGIVLFFVIFMFGLPLISYLALVPFILSAFLFSGNFLYLIFKLGLNKNGFSGKLKKLSSIELYRFLLYKRF